VNPNFSEEEQAQANQPQPQAQTQPQYQYQYSNPSQQFVFPQVPLPPTSGNIKDQMGYITNQSLQYFNGISSSNESV
jgi:hypothetical protein